MFIHKKILKYTQKLESEKQKLESENVFKEVLMNISNGVSSFRSRYMQTAYITTKIGNEEVDVMYLIDKNDIAILKDDKIIHTTDLINVEIKNSIIENINKTYSKYINDVVSIFGIIMSKIDFERSFNMSFDDFENMNKRFLNRDSEESDIDKIINVNRNRFDINEILDKINLSGIGSLSKEEKEYLKEYSKNS
jgi:hypothetical protein